MVLKIVIDGRSSGEVSSNELLFTRRLESSAEASLRPVPGERGILSGPGIDPGGKHTLRLGKWVQLGGPVEKM